MQKSLHLKFMFETEALASYQALACTGSPVDTTFFAFKRIFMKKEHFTPIDIPQYF